ncbi:MAG: putative metal-dependent hydrolase [Halioglobus sp.]|jgi:predicted metal-dependent hydrolase
MAMAHASMESGTQSRTPGTIQVRKFDTQATQHAPEYYFDNDPFKTHFLNALSVLFPEGERFFIRSVLAYRDEITDPKLLEEIRQFSAQEAQHTLVHEAMNDLAARHGYPVEKLDAINAVMLRRFSKRGKKFQFARRAALAMTVCMEHFTAILAYQVLTSGDEQFKGLDPSVKALFEWHAIEETEHKSVAFDVYQATGGGPVALRFAMLWSSFFFVFGALVNTSVLLWTDGSIRKWSTWKSGARYLFGPDEGFLIKPFGDWLAFFKPGFHPWKQHQELDTEAALAPLGSFIL